METPPQFSRDFYVGHGFDRIDGPEVELVAAARADREQASADFRPVGSLDRPRVTAGFAGSRFELPINWLLLPERTFDYLVLRLEPGGSFPEHIHGVGHEIYLVLSGSGRVWIEGTVYDAQPRDIFHLRPGQAHTLKASADGLEIFAVNAPAVEPALRSRYWAHPAH